MYIYIYIYTCIHVLDIYTYIYILFLIDFRPFVVLPCFVNIQGGPLRGGPCGLPRGPPRPSRNLPVPPADEGTDGICVPDIDVVMCLLLRTATQ